jgi:hypothetical protein
MSFKNINPLDLRTFAFNKLSSMEFYRIPHKSIESIIDAKLKRLFKDSLPKSEVKNQTMLSSDEEPEEGREADLKFNRPNLNQFKQDIDMILTYPGMFKQVKSEEDIAQEKLRKNNVAGRITKIPRVLKDDLGRPLGELG